MGLRIVPISWQDARQFVGMWHRHLDPPVGGKFWMGVADEAGILRGVAIVGRPVSRILDNGTTLEVNRTATDGTPNTNSMLYAAAWQVARGLGYTRLITYTQQGESGASLRGAGWRVIAERPTRPASAGWNAPSRPRGSRAEHMPRTLWEAV